MKTIGKVKQCFIGAIPVILLWVLAAVSQDEVLTTSIYDTLEATIFKNYDIILSSIIPTIFLSVMLIWVFTSAIIGKKYDLNYVFYSALLSGIIPPLAFLFSVIFANDSNILFWITIGLVLIPFGFLANYCFEGVSDFFCQLDISPEILALLMVVVMLISLVPFKCIHKRSDSLCLDVVTSD